MTPSIFALRRTLVVLLLLPTMEVASAASQALRSSLDTPTPAPSDAALSQATQLRQYQAVNATGASSSFSAAEDIAVTSSAHDAAGSLPIPAANVLLATQKSGDASGSSISIRDSYVLAVVIASAIAVVIISVVVIIRRRKQSTARSAAPNPWLMSPIGSIASETPVMSASSSPVEFIIQDVLGRGTSILRFSGSSQTDEPESSRLFKAQHWTFLYDNRSANADRPRGDCRSPTSNYKTQTLTPPPEGAAVGLEEEPADGAVASCWV